jgi:hypothetical protein
MKSITNSRYNSILILAILFILSTVDQIDSLACVHENEAMLHENSSSLACDSDVKFCIKAEVKYNNQSVILKGCDIHYLCRDQVNDFYS